MISKLEMRKVNADLEKKKNQMKPWFASSIIFEVLNGYRLHSKGEKYDSELTRFCGEIFDLLWNQKWYQTSDNHNIVTKILTT